jgi:hypothetical protein
MEDASRFAYPARKAIGFRSHMWILLSAQLDSWVTGTPVVLLNYIKNIADMFSATPPGYFLYSEVRKVL